jgi:broad specificity phosphatase PhoE
MTIFYICRHGQTENNLAGRFSGWIDTPLTKEGIKNAESSADKLKAIKLDQIISSDLGRAFTTAYIISRKLGYRADIERFSGLREANYGDFANTTYISHPEIDQTDKDDFTPPGGESLVQMQARVLACLTDISKANSGKSILIVGHDGTINAVESIWNKQTIGAANSNHHAHDFVAKFEWEDRNLLSFAEITQK